MEKKINDILEDTNLKNNPFSLPEGYFNKMEDSVRERIHCCNTTNNVSSFGEHFRTYSAMLVMFLLVFGIGYGVISLTSDRTIDYNGISGIINPSINTNDTISDEDLIILLGRDDIYENDESTYITKSAILTIEKNDIEEYLIDNNISSVIILASLE